jgi:hypothetical protein
MTETTLQGRWRGYGEAPRASYAVGPTGSAIEERDLDG